MVRPDTAATRAALAARRLRNRRPNNNNNNNGNNTSGLEGSSSRDSEGLGSSSWTSVGEDVTPSSSLDDMATTTATSDDPRGLRPPPAIPSTTARNGTPAATVERQPPQQPQPQLPHHLETVTPKRLSNASAAFSAAAHVASTRRTVMTTEPTQDNSHTNNNSNNITDSVRSSLTTDDNPNTSEPSRRRIQFASDTVSNSSSSSSPPNSQTMDATIKSTTVPLPPPPPSINDNDMMSPMRKIHSLLSSLPTNVAEGSNIDFLSPAGGMAGYLKRGNNHDDDPHENHDEEEEDDFEDTDEEQEEMGSANSDPLDDWGDVIPGQEDVDAMCIPYGSFLMLRSSSVGRHDTNHAVSVTAAKQPLQDGYADLVDGTIGGTHHETYMAHADGPGLGRDVERLYIVLAEHVEEIHPNDDDNTSFNPKEQSHVLYYGDVVALHSSLANDRALGVRTARSTTDQRDGGDGTAAMTMEVGFFRAVLGQAEKWTVLRGGTDKRIHIGSTVSSIPKLPDRKLPVRSGEPIVLRNLSTGGLLSIHQRDTHILEKEQKQPILTVITSAYQMNNGTASTSGHKSVHEYMNSHHLVKPSRYEQFQFVFANAPPCPSWTSARAGDCATGRVYLNGSYLLHPTRDETTDQMEATLFGSSSIPHNNVSYSNPIGKQSIAMQEKILMDEVIGSMMGLEGHYILARPSSSSSSSKGLSNDGSKISVGINNVEFQLAPDSVIGGTIDPSLVHLVERILPISTYYVRVNAFVCSHLTRYEYGTVTQALCEAMDVLLQEYLTFVSQMEQAFRSTCSPAPSSSSASISTFTMNKLYVNIQSSLLTMSILFNIVEEARTCKGGALLNAMLALMTGTYAGDEKGRDVMQFLLEKTSVPYMAMLQGWLEGGEIRDPFHEFMIESTESSALGDDSDWNNWYIVRQEHVPMAFLSPNGQSHMTSQRGKHMEDVVKKILTTGKYWNAVRLCEHKQAHSVHNSGSNGCTASDDTEPKTLHYSMGPLQIAEFIDRAYTCASDTLLSLIMKEYDLMETLRTMKRYFLLDQGDFFVHFLDAAEEELKQELSHVSRGRVQSSLSLSIQLSVGNTDDSPQYDKDNEQGQDGVVVKREMLAHQLCCDFSSQSLIDHLDDLHSQSGGIRVQETRTPSQQVYGAYNQALTGVEAFMLDFQYIPFPTSLVLSRRTLNNYQLLFRHLFFAKHVERRLTNVWADHQMMKELQSLQRALGPTYFLRQRMLHFLQNLVYYMMFEVIEPNFLSMESAILHPDGNTFGEKKYQTKEHQQTVDDVLNIHDEFVRRTLKECLLTNRDLIRNLTKLMTTCLVFSDQMTKFMEATRIGEEQADVAMQERRRREWSGRTAASEKKLRAMVAMSQEKRVNRIKKQAERIERELNKDSYKRMIVRFNEVFNSNLGEFMTQLMSDADGRYHTHLSNLCTRLDYNGFVTQSMGL